MQFQNGLSRPNPHQNMTAASERLTRYNKIRFILRLDSCYWQKLVLSMRTAVTINAGPNLEQARLGNVVLARAPAREMHVPTSLRVNKHYCVTTRPPSDSKPKHARITMCFRNPLRGVD